MKGGAAAIAAGTRACAGRTPSEVKARFLPAALRRGTIRPGSPQAAMIGEIGRYEKRIASEPSFTAGQLAADAYSATVPARLRKTAYQACIHVLARDLERRLRSSG